jgi:DNA-binding NtrC family response regulator
MDAYGNMPWVLAVDGIPAELDELYRALRHDCAFRLASTVLQAIVLLQRHEFSAVIADESLSSVSGLEFLDMIQSVRPHTARILLTADPSYPEIVDAYATGLCSAVIQKPLHVVAARDIVCGLFDSARSAWDANRLTGNLSMAYANCP